MTSKEIIINLINEQKINGEEAYVLLNDILQSEMLETYKALENKKNSEIFKDVNRTPIWVGGLTTTDNSYSGASSATTAINDPFAHI